ncbi:ligase-associated DNA damage response endonuclease PdeM [Rhizobiaceae bacterium]|nr:ligase-associated DNA damage response endonuclease PdeM [Rhizobiaceae bacterium]
MNDSEHVARQVSDDLPNEEALMVALSKAHPADALDNESQFADFSGTCVHAVNGVELVADASGVAFWPAERALLVADLHFEKGSSFARRGQMLPPYDTRITLRRLADALARWQPDKVFALGDSFHDAQAALRLSVEDRETLLSLMRDREWVWITGNHDPVPPAGLGGRAADEVRLGGLHLIHEPQLKPQPGEIAGHLHPSARILAKGRTIRRSCFVASRDRMILPSFGAYTGGLNVFDRAFNGLFDGRKFHALLRGEGHVYRIAGARLD